MENFSSMDVDTQYKQWRQQQQAARMDEISSMLKQRTGPPEVDPSEIERFHVLGDGSFGTVYAGKCRQKDVAVKVLLKQDFDEKTLQAFRHEVDMMSKIFHPNVNLFMGACTVPGQLMIVTELMRGDLESMILDEKVFLSLTTRLKMAKDAALGILWLHSSNPQTIHRDLKASNLLIDDNLTCKICDFGLSQVKPKGKNLVDGSDGAKGTPLWMAPEVMMGEEFNEKCDVYSFGLILWFLVSSREPYEEFDDLEKFTHAVCLRHYRPSIPADCDPSLSQLIQQCWHPNPSVRPGFNEIVQRLSHIIVDIAIEDPIGRQFWKENFLDKDTIAWTDFINAFCKFLRVVDNRIPVMDLILNYREYIKDTTLELDVRCMKSILAEKNKKGQTLVENDSDYFVSIEKFGSILKWFGPLSLPPFPPDGINIMQRVTRLLSEPWFHGDISTGESENRLINKPEGTFLLRFSTSSPGCYTISKVSVNDNLSIKHQKIQYRPGGYFEVNGRSYRTLQDLVLTEAPALNLLLPCMGSRFLSLFVEQKISGYVN